MEKQHEKGNLQKKSFNHLILEPTIPKPCVHDHHGVSMAGVGRNDTGTVPEIANIGTMAMRQKDN